MDETGIVSPELRLRIVNGYEIGSRIEADLDTLPHHRGIVVPSAGMMPPF